jgi:hypothetical protein
MGTDAHCQLPAARQRAISHRGDQSLLGACLLCDWREVARFLLNWFTRPLTVRIPVEQRHEMPRWAWPVQCQQHLVNRALPLL